jgi:predicted nucleic acid-binding protein
MVIVDTTVWVDYFRGRDTYETKWLDDQLDVRRMGLTDLILAEVLQGIRPEIDAFTAGKTLTTFEVFNASDDATVIEAAKYSRSLRRRGRAVTNTIDCLTATFCIRNKHTLLHADWGFDQFARFFGLRDIRDPRRALAPRLTPASAHKKR